MKAVFTARRLVAGHYDEWRQAWEPAQWPRGTVKAYIMRDLGDPDQVTAIGLFDLSDDEAARLRDALEESEKERHAAMAPHIEQTLVAGLFDVVYEVQGEAEGKQAIVPLTERQITPDQWEQYVAAAQGAMDEGDPPEGMARFLALLDTSKPGHLIQLGVIKSDDIQAMRSRMSGGRERMLEAIAPYVESVGIDTTYELVEEVVPVSV
jgi:hypothetical protein